VGGVRDGLLAGDVLAIGNAAGGVGHAPGGGGRELQVCRERQGVSGRNMHARKRRALAATCRTPLQDHNPEHPRSASSTPQRTSVEKGGRWLVALGLCTARVSNILRTRTYAHISDTPTCPRRARRRRQRAVHSPARGAYISIRK
jgi:hypothetical protein